MIFAPMSRCGSARGGRAAGALSALVGAGVAVAIASGNHGVRPTPSWIVWTIVGLAIVVAFGAFMRHLMSTDAPAESDDPSSDERGDDSRYRLVVIAGLIACLLGLGLFLAISPRTVSSQEPTALSRGGDGTVQSAFVLTRGGDTIVVERLTRGISSVTADLTMKGQARMIFTAELAAGPRVPMLSFKAWGSGASIDSPPLQSGTQRLTADSAFIVVDVGGTERKLTRAVKNNPLPIMNNDFVMIELAIERARAKGAIMDTVPMFALSGGVQLDCTIEFVGSDTAVFRIAGQETRFGIDAAGHITGGVLPSQNVVITRVDGAAVANIAIGRPDYGAPVGAPYTAEEVTVHTSLGHLLTGTLTIPSNATGKVPAVVTITGSGQQDRDEYIPLVPGYRIFRQVADTLGRRGIAVLRMDDRAINGSGGDVTKATSADFADDIRAGVEFLRARPEIDGARIALVGHSEGGMIAPLVASTDATLQGIVILAGPGYTGRRISEIQNDTAIAQAPDLTATQRDSLRRLVPAALDSVERAGGWTAFYLKYDPLATARRVKVPVLILQGATDQQITPEQAPLLEKAFRAGGNRDVTMVLFTDRNHLFLRDSVGSFYGYSKLTNPRVEGDVMGTLADWLAVRLKP